MSDPVAIPVAISEASLEIVFSNRPRRIVAIEQSPFLIGRGSENGNHLAIDDSRISRKCAAIVQADGAYQLQDVGQLQGLFVNEEKVAEKLLCDGDAIRLGVDQGCKLIFRIGATKPVIEHLSTQALRIPVKDGQAASEGLGKLNMLLEATLLLHSQQPLDAVLGAMLDHAISITKADRGMLLEPESSGSLKVRVAHNSKGESLPPEHMKPSRTVLGQAIESQSAVINEDVHLANLSVQSADSVVYQLLRATVVIPLYGAPRGLAETPLGVPERQLVGAVYLDSKRTAAFSALDRQILDALAVQAASIIDNANLVERERERQRLEQELSIAREIQQALLPQGLQDYPHLIMTGVHRPCHEVGGDYFDVFPLSEDRTAILIADVSGKGLGAALLTTMLQGALSGMTLGVDPARVFHHMNRFLCEHAIVGRYATMFFGMLGRDGTLEFIRAGHPSPLLLRGGAVSDLYSGGSFPVGLLEEATFSTITMQLEPGDTLLLFSDGVNEAEDGQGRIFGFTRLREVLAGHAGDSLESLQQAILDAVERFTQGASQSDDITLLAVRFRTPVDAGTAI
jgi:phosphoserine phosphatase RsbU/P